MTDLTNVEISGVPTSVIGTAHIYRDKDTLVAEWRDVADRVPGELHAIAQSLRSLADAVEKRAQENEANSRG